MGLIKEPIGVDFYTTGKEMSAEDQRRVSEYLRAKKARKKRKQTKSESKESDEAKV